MRSLLLLGLFLGVASAYTEKCAWGESYWCSGIKEAKDCGAFQHCMTTVWPNQKLPADNTDVCTYCETIIQDVRNFVGNKQSQAQLQQFLDSACSIIPVKTISAQCTTTVDTYLPEVLDLITAELDPQVVCSLLGVCNGLEDKVEHHEVIHHVTLVKAPLASRTDVPICTDCKKLLQDLETMATSPETEQELENLLEQQLCPLLGNLADECKALVAVYIPELLDLLAGELDPEMICQAIGLCNQTSNYARTLLAKMKMATTQLYQEAVKVAGPEECDLCKTIVGELQAMEKDNATQEELETFIKTQICSKLGALKGACIESVDQYGPELFAFLAQELDPQTFCNAIGLCTGQRREQKSNNLVIDQPVSEPKVEASQTCVLCEFVMKQLDDMLANNSTEEEIVAALDKVCSVLPSTISSECTQFVNTYGPGILILLEQELQPQLVCTALGLCSSQSLKFVPKKVASSELCGICETMIQYLDTVLTENSTVQEIEQALDKVCSLLPDTMKTECDNIVQQYGPIIVKLIPQFADPAEVCQTLGLCQKKVAPTTKKPIMVGQNECTYGPAYWCASKENAKKCKAEEHCRRHVWSNMI